MKRNSLITVITLVLLCVGAVGLYYHAANGSHASTVVASSFADANTVAKQGDLKAAIRSYEKLIEGGIRNSAVYYNLANAQQRAGMLGAAILNYERAAVLDPLATDVAANLAIARTEAAAIEAEPVGWPAFVKDLSIDDWTALGATALLITTLVLATAVFVRLAVPRGLRYAGVSVVVLTIGLSVAAVWTLTKESKQAAIVLSADTPLRVSPFKESKANATLPAGRFVRILPDEKHDGYQLAELRSGEQGWLVPGQEFETITHE